MDNNNLLIIILAFVVGYCLPSMMKNMCGGRLVEGYGPGSTCSDGGMGGQYDCNGWGVDRNDLTCSRCNDGTSLCTKANETCSNYNK